MKKSVSSIVVVIAMSVLSACSGGSDTPSPEPSASSASPESIPERLKVLDPTEQQTKVAADVEEFYAALYAEGNKFGSNIEETSKPPTYAAIDKFFPRTLSKVARDSFPSKKNLYLSVLYLAMNLPAEIPDKSKPFYTVVTPFKIAIEGNEAVIPQAAFGDTSADRDKTVSTFVLTDGTWLFDGATFTDKFFTDHGYNMDAVVFG